MPAYKHMDLAKFDTPDDVFAHGRIQCLHTLFYKKNKPDIWYYKSRGPGCYEAEAIAADLFRFALGKERAAKALVARHEQKACGLLSQHNRAGFSDLDFFRLQGIEKDLTIAAGVAELAIAEYVFGDIDGIENSGNVGFNHQNEVSRIDFGLAFYYSAATETDIGAFAKKKEKQVLATCDVNVINRFYQVQMRLLLLDRPLSEIIFGRHSDDIKRWQNTINAMLARMHSLKAYFLQSENFRAFINQYDFNHLVTFVQDFFKSEQKKLPEIYQNILEWLKPVAASDIAAPLSYPVR